MTLVAGCNDKEHLQPSLFKVPDCDDAGASARRQERHANACTRCTRCRHEHRFRHNWCCC